MELSLLFQIKYLFFLTHMNRYIIHWNFFYKSIKIVRHIKRKKKDLVRYRTPNNVLGQETIFDKLAIYFIQYFSCCTGKIRYTFLWVQYFKPRNKIYEARRVKTNKLTESIRNLVYFSTPLCVHVQNSGTYISTRHFNQFRFSKYQY